MSVRQLVVALLIGSCSILSGQEDPVGKASRKFKSPVGFKELLLKSAITREGLVQFDVRVAIEGEYSSPYLRTPLTNEAPKKSEFQFEYSKVNKHRIFARRAWENGAWTSWDIGGVSGKYYIHTSNRKLLIRDWAESRPPTPAGGLNIKLFDVRGIGLGTYGDLLRGATFEELTRYLMENPVSVKEVRFDEDSGHYQFKDLGAGIEFSIDPSRGYWPTRFSFAPPNSTQQTRWTVELRKFEDEYVPRRAKLEYKDLKQKTEKKLLFDFQWQSVNKPVEVGLPAIDRIADAYGLRIDDSSIRAK